LDHFGKLRSLIKLKNRVTAHETHSVKIWSGLNQTMAIAWCQTSTIKKRLWGVGSEISGEATQKTRCNHVPKGASGWTRACLELRSLRKNGHCMVPRRHKKDKSHSTWVSIQQRERALNETRPDHKDLLDKLKFVWRSDGLHKSKHKKDESHWTWVSIQQRERALNETRPDHKDLLDKLKFVWRSDGLHKSS
jgi:hypothetical protein